MSIFIPNSFLIVGINSRVGSSLFQSYLNEGLLVFGTSRRNAEVKDNIYYLNIPAMHSDLEKIPEVSVVFLCAYVSNMSECADDSNSELINIKGVIDLAHYFLDKGSFVIFLSSNAVFNNNQNYASEIELPNPKSIYGKQKFEAESQILNLISKNLMSKFVIVRMTKILSEDLPLLRNWRNEVLSGGRIIAYENVRISPISLSFVVNSLKKIANLQISGIFHLSGDNEFTYLNIAKKITQIIGVSSIQVLGIKAPEKSPSKLNSISLSMAHSQKALGINPENYDSLKINVFNLLKD